MPSPFSDRLHAMIAALRSIEGVTVSAAEVGDPCSDDEIAQVEAALGHALSARFLDYYRSANGARLAWSSAGGSGGFSLLPLGKVFLTNPGYLFGHDSFGPGDDTLPLLGGLDEHATRLALRVVDALPKDGNEYPTVAIYTDAQRAEPVMLFPNDACAALGDAHPMLATSYFEMLLATAGHEGALHDFTSRGHSGPHELIAWGAEDWASLGSAATYVRWLGSRGDIKQNYRPAMAKLMDVLRAGTSPAEIGPKRWLELRYDVTYPS